MCKLLVAFKKPGNIEVLDSLWAAQYNELSSEKDGYGCLIVQQDNTVKTFRSLTKYDAIYGHARKALSEAKIVAMHTRTASSGNVDEENVHFFRNKDIFFAHNGVVSEYIALKKSFPPFTPKASFQDKRVERWQSNIENIEDVMFKCKECYEAAACEQHTEQYKLLVNLRGKVIEASYADDDFGSRFSSYALPGCSSNVAAKQKETKIITTANTEDEKCDSRRFMEALPKKLSVPILEDLIKESRFWGMGFIVDAAKKKYYIMAHKANQEVITDHNSFLLMSSYKMSRKLTYTYNSFVGIKLEKEVNIDLSPFDVPDYTYEGSFNFTK